VPTTPAVVSGFNPLGRIADHPAGLGAVTFDADQIRTETKSVQRKCTLPDALSTRQYQRPATSAAHARTVNTGRKPSIHSNEQNLYQTLQHNFNDRNVNQGCLGT